jgi:hypothetical protein
MDLITFRCSSCNQGLKVPADKAGRRVKCTKCGTSLTVPATSQAGTVPGAKPAAPRKHYEDDDDEGGIYGVSGVENPISSAPSPLDSPEERKKKEAEAKAPVPTRRRDEDEEEDEDEDDVDLDDELSPEEIAERDEELRRRLLGLDEEEEEEEEDEEYDEALPEDERRRRRKPRAKLDVPAWLKVRVGVLLVIISVSLWALWLLLHEVVVVIGLFAGPQYSEVLVAFHPDYNQGEAFNYKLEPDLYKLVIGMIGGKAAIDANLILERIALVVLVLAHCLLLAGAAICLAVPRRFGTKGLALATLIVAAVNLIAAVIFQLLPGLGVMKWSLVPLVGRELPLLSANEERIFPLHMLWGPPPYLQILLSVFILAVSYGELIMFPLFLRAVGKSLKSERLEESALTLTRLGLSQIFVQVAYQMMAMTGSSDVLGWVLRTVYAVGLGFFIGQLTYYIIVLVKSRALIQTVLDQEEKRLA